MPKKIFDILPPVFPEKKISPSSKKKKYLKIKGKALVIFSILISAGIFSYFIFKEARIEIWPMSEVLTFKKEIIIDSTLKESNLALWIKDATIPGKFLEEKKDIFQQFSSSGTKIIKEKSEGIIRVYNNYHESVSLVANTRFLTADGKLFYSKNKIYIPAGSFIDTKVEAAEFGPDYNIKPSTFSIPGLVGYPSYTAIYGKSFSAMTGGFLNEVSQVTKDDLEEAKNILTEKLKKEGKESLENNIGDDYILLEKAIVQEVTEASSLVPVGSEVEKFTFQLEIKSKAIVFKKENLENFVKGFIINQIENSKKIHEESLKINYFLQSVDLETGKIVLSLEFSAKIYSDIDIFSIKKVISGKSLKETQIILENHPQIVKVQVKLWPFWVKKVPYSEGKIKINLKVD